MAKTKPLMHNPYSPDPETFGETMQNLGVTVERRGGVEEITGAKWASKPYQRRKSLLINVTDKGIHFPSMVGENSGKVMLGVGQYRGKVVLVLKEDPNGYTLTALNNRRATIRYTLLVKKVVNDLLAAGLKPGLYKPTKIKDGWMGVLE